MELILQVKGVYFIKLTTHDHVACPISYRQVNGVGQVDLQQLYGGGFQFQHPKGGGREVVLAQQNNPSPVWFVRRERERPKNRPTEGGETHEYTYGAHLHLEFPQRRAFLSSGRPRPAALPTRSSQSSPWHPAPLAPRPDMTLAVAPDSPAFAERVICCISNAE